MFPRLIKVEEQRSRRGRKWKVEYNCLCFCAPKEEEGVRDLLIVYEGESIGCLAMEDARGGWLADKQGLREIHNLNKFHVRRDPYSVS